MSKWLAFTGSIRWIGKHTHGPADEPGPDLFERIIMNEKCKDCRYCRDGNCFVLLWTDGGQRYIGAVPENGHCALWEAKNERV